MTVRLIVSVAIFAGSIVAANVMTARLELVPIGFGLVVTAGTFAAGFALLARDLVQTYGGLTWGFVAIATGGILSFAFATPGIVVASVVAFVGAELVDLFVFTPLRPHGFAVAAIASNTISAPVDTVLFLHLSGFGITQDAVLGQFVAKVVLATLIPVALFQIGRSCSFSRTRSETMQ